MRTPNTADDQRVFVPSHRGAVFSGEYRYLLWRTWDVARPRLLWVMLNPSVADETKDDPTIRRCVGFSRQWGYGGLDVVNLFALRTSDPKILPFAADPVGPENDRYIAEAARHATEIAVAWGEHGGYMRRDPAVRALLGRHAAHPLQCLGFTKNNSPRHPLYVPRDTPLVPYRIGSGPGESGIEQLARDDRFKGGKQHHE